MRVNLLVLARLLWLQGLLNQYGLTLTYSPWRGAGKEWMIFAIKTDKQA